jgi:hypothetical protein
MKKNDVFFWSYNDKTLKARNDGNNGGTTYWCCSRTAIYDGQYLRDTYWRSASSNKSWTQEEVDKYLALTFLGNLDDYIPADECERGRYKDSDCLDLNHSNSPSGNFYIRKNAKVDLDKIKRLIKREEAEMLSKIRCMQDQLSSIKERFDNVSEASWISWGTPLSDDHYLDNQEDN